MCTGRYDAVNQTKTFVFPGGGQESYNYDANGNLTKLTNRAGQEITYTYDDADRLTQKTYVGGSSTVFAYTYDDANRLIGLSRASGTSIESSIGYTYNAANQVTAATSNGWTVGYTYDLSQNVSQIIYPSSEVVKYDYDNRNALSQIKTGSSTAIATYTRDDAGRVTKRALANGLETVYTWNDADRITKFELRETATPSNVLQSFEYGYDKVGNRLWVKNQDGRGDVYQYDATYQVTGVKYGVDDPTVGYGSATNPVRTVTYAYDAVGNRTSVNDGGTPMTYTVNSLNQYTAVGGTNYIYSARGDLISDGTWTYGYDSEGHLISASKAGMNVTYQYDAIGRRIEKNVNGTVTHYVYNEHDLIEERDASGSITAKYIYENGIDQPVKVIKGTNEYYFQQDVIGNITALTSHTGSIVEYYSYDVFGRPTARDSLGNVLSNSLTPFLFTGREYDSETELYHYRSRAYSPSLGRFLQPDSVAFGGGDVNLYRYVNNNVTTFKDPTGRWAPNLAAAAIGAVFGGLFSGFADAAHQLATKDPCEEIDWKSIRRSAIFGAVGGAITGASFGAAGLSIGTAGSVAGDIATAGVAGSYLGKATGAIGGALGL